MTSNALWFCEILLENLMTLLFALTAMLSAFLLFLVQPLIAKPILPLLGGSPAVWITCMVTFQILLLVGYIYAYASSRYLTVQRHGLLHLALFAVSFFLLPFALRRAGFEPIAHPQLWLVATLLRSVGGPYFLLSSSAPMLQRWAANTSHPLAQNPYPLYAASNVGSFLGLLAYPLLIEPRFDTNEQFWILTAGYLSLVFGFVACATVMLRYARHRSADVPTMPATPTDKAALWRWLGYSGIAASLLYGTTTYIVTDIASVPLLWIIPLLLYIATFIFAFSDRGWKARGLLVPYLLLTVPTLLLVVFGGVVGGVGIPPLVSIAVTLGALFVGSLLFHRRLYELRPPAESSGLFYVFIALGGAIGGSFNSFVAPQIFHTAAEFPLVLALGLFVVLLPDFLVTNVYREKRFPKKVAWLLAVLLAGATFFGSTKINPFAGWHLWISGAVLMATMFAVLMLSDWLYLTWRLILPAVLLALLLGGYFTAADTWLYSERNFFGISHVREEKELARRVYAHGVTLHGVQSTEEKYRLVPGTYYGPLRDIVTNLPDSVSGAPVGVIGLGVGVVACYASPNQAMDFYEIDPAAIHIATDPTYFTYMRDCPGDRRIIVGDGRINLAKAPDERYGFFILDAFTSDAIPMHLLTLEALSTYGQKLQPDGLMAFNISNRYLDLLPVFRTISAELGWTALYRYDIATDHAREVSSLWVVLAKNEKSMEPLARLGSWKPLPPESGKLYRWTDDYTNLLGILRFSPEWLSALQ
jgi:spermidine synthase